MPSFLKSKGFFFSVFFILIAFVSGFLLGNLVKSSKPPVEAPKTKTSTHPLFTSQTATIKGKIIKVNSSSLTIENAKGLKGDLNLPETLYITKYDEKGKPSSSDSINELKEGQNVIISFEARGSGGDFRVVAINIIPEISPSAGRQE